MDWKQYLKKELQREKYISKNDVAQSYILKIGKLNKGTITYVVEQLRFKKMEVQNKVKSIIDAFYNENLQILEDDLAKILCITSIVIT